MRDEKARKPRPLTTDSGAPVADNQHSQTAGAGGPVNRPHATHAANYGRDGAMRFDGNHGRAKNFEPNSSDGPAQTGRPLYAPIEVHGVTGSHAPELHAEDDDFVQAGALYRLMTEPERARLIASIAGNLAQVTRKEIIDRSIGHFRKADPEYGARLDQAVEAHKARP